MAVDGTPQPAGNEFLVNTSTLNAQTNAAIAGLTDGGFVVAWQSDAGDDTGRLGIFVQRYDASGNKVGAETLIFHLIYQANPSVAALTDGGFVVTFDASPPPAPTYLGYDIRVARFNADGTRSIGAVTDYNGLGDFASSVVGLPGGGFVVTWQSEQVDGTFDILAQRYDASGTRVGSVVQVNTTVADGQFAPHVAVLAGGGFVVAWQSEAQDGSGLGIFGRHFDQSGAAVGGEFQINTHTSNDQISASVAGLSIGGFVVVWESTEQDGSSGGIYGQVYDSSGNRIGGEFPINTYTSNWQGNPTVTAFADGHFVVVWQSAGQDGSGDGVYGQLFSATGQKIGGEFLINETTEGNQIDPVVTVLGPNDFEVAWTSGGDIFARHFTLSTSNHAPVASDFLASVNENAASVLLKGVYTDSDAADTFTFSTNTTGTVGLVTNNHDGTFNYDPNGKFESLSVGDTATDTFTYTVTDNHGASSTATATVTIHGENDAPLAAPDYATVQIGGTITADAAHGVRANDHDPDTHDTLHVSALGFGSTAVTVTPNGPATIKGAFGTLTLNADGSYSYKALSAGTKSGQDVFTYTVDDGHGGQATSALVVTVQPTGVVKSGSAGLQSASHIFQSYGTDGEIVVLAALSEAAYHLVPGIEKVGVGINIPDPIADAFFNFLPTGMQVLTAADLPSLSPLSVPGDPNFPTFGLVNGIYLDSNAAALAARSSDSLFISFRGTNDYNDPLLGLFGELAGVTPDTKDWKTLGDYYAKLTPFVSAVDNYLIAHPEIQHVYVTGHSLGASMAQKFMTDHIGNMFQAVTFSNPGYGFSLFADDPRITNVLVADDPIRYSPYLVKGDIYQIVDSDGSSGGGSSHDMLLYYNAAQFLSAQHDGVPQQSLISNGVRDLVNVFTDITYTGNLSDRWHVSFPTGTVVGSIHNDIIGVTGGGTLTGGPGNDTFFFEPGFGLVTIKDFQPGEDTIQIDPSLFGNPKAVLANAHTYFDSNGVANTTIWYDASDLITLSGVKFSQLHTTDFHTV